MNSSLSLSGVFLLSCPPYVFLVFLFFHPFPSAFSHFPHSHSPLLRGETKLADRVHELICLFIFIYWDIKHRWSPIIPPLLPVSVPVLMWTQFHRGRRKWTLLDIFPTHFQGLFIVSTGYNVWHDISHATNTLKVFRTSGWRWTIRRTPGQNVIHHCFLLVCGRVNWKHEKRHGSSCEEPGVCDS